MEVKNIVKAKKFSHKLLALFMAVVMALTCFSGVMTSYAASNDTKYYDSDVYFNSLGWSILSDEQTATAILDYLDGLLAENASSIYNWMASNLPTSGIYYYIPTNRILKVSVAGQEILSVEININSIDSIINTIASLESNIRGLANNSLYKSLVGNITDLHFTATAGMSRSKTSSCDILKGILGLIQQNITYFPSTSDSNDFIGQLLRGTLDLSTVGSFVDVYGIIGDLLGLDDGYESNMIYNIVKQVLFNYTGWFTETEIANYKSNPDSFKLDTVLLDKMTSELLDKININITYPDGTSSQSRYKEIQEYIASHSGATVSSASTALGYDPDLVYNDSGNILLFKYGYGTDQQTLKIDTTTKVLEFGYQALDLAWKTALSPTIKLIHVNNWSNNEKGSNFDNEYYYWAKENLTGGWNQSDLTKMYTTANLNTWANSNYEKEDGSIVKVYEAYDCSSAQEFLDYVKSTLTFDRSEVTNGSYNWRDIDSTKLFDKLRYSPLADYGFNIQTGPINLYFMETGTSNLDTFFANYAKGEYTSIVGGLNNALVAAVKDFFPQRSNIKGKSSTAYPSLYTTDSTINKASSFDTTSMRTLASKIIDNALKVIQYTADTIDLNILSGFYKTGQTTLSEANIEEAMIPLLIACIGQINLGHGKLNVLIHGSDWDACKDFEGVMFVALQEYLSSIFPDRDYKGTFTKSGALSTNSDGKYVVNFDKVILPMARDALAYVLAPNVPITNSDGVSWKLTDTTNFGIESDFSIWDLLNSVICYYADDYALSNGGKGIGIAALLGLCDNNGNSKIKSTNEIWTNIDTAVNTLAPVAGCFQTGSNSDSGKVSSKEFLYNDIILGLCNIGDNSTSTHSSGLYGASNLVYKLLVAVTCEPLSTQRLEVTVYNFLADLFNVLFGARYTDQPYYGVKTIPTFDSLSTSAQQYPFDNLLQKDVIVGTGAQKAYTGVLQRFFYNMVEASGFGRTGGDSGSLSATAKPDSVVRGAMFIISSVNSFLDIIPTLSEHEFNMATATLDDTTAFGFNFEDELDTTLMIKNNCEGINIAYVDSNGNAQSTSRYAIYLKSITTTSSTGEVYESGVVVSGTPTASYTVNEVLMPSAIKQYDFVGKLEGGEDDPTTLTVTYTYNVLEIDSTGKANTANPIYSNLTGVVYQYITPATSWESTIYEDSKLASNYQINTASQSTTKDGFVARTSKTFGTNSGLILNYPETLVTSNDEAKNIENLKVRVYNTGSNAGSFSGYYVYDTKTVLDDATNSTVSVTSANAIPVFDEKTGNLIAVDRYDTSTDGKNWDTNNGVGYDYTTLSSMQEKDTSLKSRTHIAYTFEEAKSAGIISAYHKDGDTFEYIYLKATSALPYSTLVTKMSMRGPVDGLYINNPTSAVSVASKSDYTDSIFKYDSSVTAGEYSVNLVAVSTSNTTTVDNFTLVVGNDAKASSVQSKYNEVSDVVANFRKNADFDSSKTSVYDDAVTALQDTLKTLAEPLTPSSAKAMNDTTVLKASTTTTTSTTGDTAYVPLTDASKLPLAIKNSVYTKNGCYYLDADCTLPIYSNTKLSSNGVTSGKDKAGMAVEAGVGENASTYYYVNTPVYETKWDTTTYKAPYQVEDTSSQQTNDSGLLLYSAVKFEYRDSNNNVVGEDGDWVIKVPVTYTDTKTNDGTDYRGSYTSAVDRLDYAIDQINGAIKESVKNQLFNSVTLVRYDLNATNFEPISYKAMTSYAQKLEKLYTITLTYTEKGSTETKSVTITPGNYSTYANNGDITITKTSVNCTVSSIQAEQYVKMFNNLIDHVTERGYLGNQLEAEIKCASGNEYNDMTAVAPEKDNDGNITTNGTITVKNGANTPKFGKVVNGQLVNDGYTASSWNNYINALATAVDLATLGNGSYTHKGIAYYKSSEKSTYTAQLATVYYVDSALQTAENSLTLASNEPITVTVAEATGGYVKINGTPYSSPKSFTSSEEVTIEAVTDSGYTFTGFMINGELITANPYKTSFESDVTITPVYSKGTQTGGNTVSGSIVVAKNNKGGTNGIPAYGEYTFTVYSDSDLTNEVGTFTSTYDSEGAVNNFALVLPDGTYYATLSSTYAITRDDITITVSGSDIEDVVIPVFACDFDKDGLISSLDASLVFSGSSGKFEGADYCDLDGDGVVTSLDASIVFSCAAGSLSLTPVDIK
jgi:hypothetical protein